MTGMPAALADAIPAQERYSGKLHGPFTVPGAPLVNEEVPSLFIGTITCRLVTWL
jgi:hypothetical protein